MITADQQPTRWLTQTQALAMRLLEDEREGAQRLAALFAAADRAVEAPSP